MMRTLLTMCCLLMTAPVFAQPSLLGTLQAGRAQYPTPMAKAQLGELLTRVASSAPGWVLLAKPAGNNCPTPMAVFVACDILIYAPSGQGYDVFIDQEGAAIPAWQTSDHFSADRFVAVPAVPIQTPAPVPVPVSIPSPGPPSAPSPGIDLSAALQRLSDQAAQYHAEEMQAINHPGWFTTVFGNKYVQMGLAGIATCLSTKCWQPAAK